MYSIVDKNAMNFKTFKRTGEFGEEDECFSFISCWPNLATLVQRLSYNELHQRLKANQQCIQKNLPGTFMTELELVETAWHLSKWINWHNSAPEIILSYCSTETLKAALRRAVQSDCKSAVACIARHSPLSQTETEKTLNMNWLLGDDMVNVELTPILMHELGKCWSTEYRVKMSEMLWNAAINFRMDKVEDFLEDSYIRVPPRPFERVLSAHFITQHTTEALAALLRSKRSGNPFEQIKLENLDRLSNCQRLFAHDKYYHDGYIDCELVDVLADSLGGQHEAIFVVYTMLHGAINPAIRAAYEDKLRVYLRNRSTSAVKFRRAPSLLRGYASYEGMGRWNIS